MGSTRSSRSVTSSSSSSAAPEKRARQGAGRSRLRESPSAVWPSPWGRTSSLPSVRPSGRARCRAGRGRRSRRSRGRCRRRRRGRRRGSRGARTPGGRLGLRLWWRAHARACAVDVGVDRQGGLHLRELQLALIELDAIDREQTTVSSQCAPADIDEVAQPEEKIGELEEVAVEDDGDRDDLIPAQQCRGLRRNRLELDAALPGDVRQLQNDPRLVRLVRHRLGQSEKIRDANLLRVLRLREQGPCLGRSEEHTSELQSRRDLVCRLLLEKKKRKKSCLNLEKKKKKTKQKKKNMK